MTTKMQGSIVEISITPTGDELEVAAALGATTLVVGDISDFSEDGGDLQIEVDPDELPDTPVEVYTLSYTGIDDETDTITLAEPLPVAAPIDTPVYVYPRSEEKWAMVDLDGWDDAILARLPHYLHADLTDEIRDEGIAVMVRMDGTEWVVDDILGEGEEMLFGDAFGSHVRLGQRGMRGYRLSADGTTIEPTLIIDAEQGNISIIGEFGTAMPEDVGIFMFKTSGASPLGGLRERPTLQFNVGAGRAQPSIYADSVELSGLFLYSGADTGERETSLRLDDGQATLWIEDTPGSRTFGTYVYVTNEGFSVDVKNGGRMDLTGDLDFKSRNNRYGTYEFIMRSRQSTGEGVKHWSQVGFENANGFQGMRIDLNSKIRFSIDGPLEVTNADSTAWGEVHASDFIPLSDRTAKQNLCAPSLVAMDVIRQAPVYEWEYVGDPSERRLGVMSNDLPDQLAVPMESDDGTGFRGLSLVQQVAIVWQGLQEIDVELDRVPGLRDTTPDRAEREEPADGSEDA